MNWCNKPLYNRIVSVEVVEDDDITEPVTLAELKAHIRVTFTDDDDYITMLINAARLAIERFTGLSLVAKTITAIIDNGEGNLELPYGPVTDDPVVLDSEGDTVESTVGGAIFKWLKTPYNMGLNVSYAAGYEAVPGDLKLAIMHEAAYQYENRGDVTKETMSPIAKGLAKAHRRVAKVL